MFLFLLMAVIAVAASIAMITVRNSVHSALLLVVVFFCLSVLYLTLNAEFLAVVQIVVYAGAIMVLFLFVITLLNPGREETDDRLPSQRPLAFALGLALIAEVALLLRTETVRAALGAFPPAKPFIQQISATLSIPATPGMADAPAIGNTQAVGFELFSTYVLPFEVISLVLLLAVIGVIVLAKRQLR
jgi:NADH-quinone oxidoreductase subunit J